MKTTDRNENRENSWESKTCTRCGGSGQYSYTPMYGTRCFACGGRGITLTKRGAAARDAFLASEKVLIEDAPLGTIVMVSGKWHKILENSLPLDGSASLVDGVWIPSTKIVLVQVDARGNELAGRQLQLRCCRGRTTPVAAKTPGYTERRAAAIARQEEDFTKTGTPCKQVDA